MFILLVGSTRNSKSATVVCETLFSMDNNEQPTDPGPDEAGEIVDSANKLRFLLLTAIIKNGGIAICIYFEKGS